MNGILRLSVSNFLRIKAAEVNPDGSLVIVAGKNEQGKSSLLNAIAAALSGKNVPAKPIHDGAAKAVIVLETDTLIVTRTFSQTGGGSLIVKRKDGVPVMAPQTMLDELTGRISFDPLEFTKMDDAKQLATLKNIVGLDFTELDAQRARLFAQRTEVGQRKRLQEGKAAAVIFTPDMPADEISVAELSRELQDAQAHNRANQDEREELSALNDNVAEAEQELKAANAEIERLKKLLEAAEAVFQQKTDALTTVTDARDKKKRAIAVLEDIDERPIIERISTSDTTNSTIRANKQWQVEQDALKDLTAEYERLTTEIAGIDATREKKLAEAKFPVPGLGFNESGVTYKGSPFAQASSAAKIRTSLGIGRALNPKLPVMFIREASLLDEDSLALVKEFAEETESQLWLEVVGYDEEATVVIEDGTVIAEPTKTKKKQPK